MSTPPLSFQVNAPASLLECFGVLPDPRIDRTRCHRLIDILVIGFCSTLAGGEGFNDMELFGKAKEEWFRTFLELPNGIPTHDTFSRVFQAIDPQAFLECFLRWTEGLRHAVNALKREKSKRSMRQKVKNAGWSNVYLLGVLGIDPS
ncbi:MAG: ISAs1 family transposase [bacterium]